MTTDKAAFTYAIVFMAGTLLVVFGTAMIQILCLAPYYDYLTPLEGALFCAGFGVVSGLGGIIMNKAIDERFKQ